MPRSKMFARVISPPDKNIFPASGISKPAIERSKWSYRIRSAQNANIPHRASDGERMLAPKVRDYEPLRQTFQSQNVLQTRLTCLPGSRSVPTMSLSGWVRTKQSKC